MSRIEKILIGELLSKWPEIKADDARKWLYTLNELFDGLSPFSFNTKFGSKKWKVKLKKIEDKPINL